MSPFRGKTEQTWRGRLHDREGRRYVRSLGTRHKREAVLIESFCARCRERRDWRTLDAIIAGEVTAAEAYYASLDGTLGEVLDAKAAAAAIEAEPDLDALVAEWAPLARSAKYVRQVRGMIREGERYPLSAFTRAAISRHLASLACSEPTKNRHRVALSQFARWLVERDYLTQNPVRDVRGFKERDPRMVHYTRTETKRVSDMLLPFQRAAVAFMWGAGLEVSAVLALTREDVNLHTREVTARGTKNRWRTRTVRVTEDAAWAIIADYLARVHLLPRTPLFPGLTERRLLEAQQEACKLAGVTVSRLHDWRHTYAVQALRDGLPPQTVKRQLGHSPHSTMLERVYAAWIPKGDADYLSTNLATSAVSTPKTAGAK